MTRLKRSLDGLASRGRPRGAMDVFAEASNGADTSASPIKAQDRPWTAFVAAFGGVLVLGVLAAILLPGSPFNPSSEGPTLISEDEVILLVGVPSDTGDGAMIYGQLIVGEGGCLAVTRAEAGTFLLVFPAGSVLVPGAATPTVSVPGSDNISVGQFVTGGGGYASATVNNPQIPEIPADCAAPGSEVAIAWTIRPEPTTTTVPQMATLPSTSPGPGPTVPQGAELSWYDFIPGSVQLAWRSTATGTELCWRTVVAEHCVDDDFRAPEVVVIPHGSQLVVISRRPLSGLMPDRAILELSNGDTMNAAPLYQGPGVDLVYAYSNPIPEGVTVVSARTADWPAPSCQTPPSSALNVSGSAFDMAVSTSPARAGQIIELSVARSRQDNITGIPTFWQCWDGSDWINTHVGTKMSRDSAWDPEVYRIESGPAFALPGIIVPDTFRIRVPDLPPGTYRIEDYVGTELGWVIVEIED
jgi:hypothetical protein